MKSFAASITIRATPEAIWQVLVDGQKWTSWNPTIERLEGTIEPGARLKVFTKISPKQAFPVRVTEFTPAKRMVWTGGMPFGVFKGERTFDLKPGADGTEFTMREAFTGPMAVLICRTIPDLQPAFDEFVAALKTRCER